MRLLLAILAVAAAAGCRAPAPNGTTEIWGSMREVMREGATQGRVEVDDVLDSDSVVGLGALEGLQGEIAILDGVAWIARVEHGRLHCAPGAAAGERATLLAVSDVREWLTLRLDEDVAPDRLGPLLAQVAAESGLGSDDPWPFVIHGDLVGVESHVLNGQCPYAGPVDPEHEPIRRTYRAVRGKLVGFHAPASAGVLVHHGDTLHVHVIVESPEVYVGHVERVGVLAGARLLVPRR